MVIPQRHTSHSTLHTSHSLNFTLRLDKHPESRYNRLAIGVWRSLVSRLVRVQEASGSNPDTPTKNVGIAFAVPAFFIRVRIRKGGQHEVLVKSMPVAYYLARGRIPFCRFFEILSLFSVKNRNLL